VVIFLTSTGNLPAQQAANGGLTCYLFSIQKVAMSGPHILITRVLHNICMGTSHQHCPIAKDDLLQRFSAVGVELGMQNKAANAFGITYHPQISGSVSLIQGKITKTIW
jgi:hypothetical protein